MRHSSMACVLGLMLVAGAGAVGSAQDEPIFMTEEIKPPERTVFVQPVYPEAARKDRIEGKVLLQIVVGRTGQVEDARVIKSDGPFDEAAMEAVKQWRFSPALKDGKAVTVYMTVTVAFRLDGKSKEDLPTYLDPGIKPPERTVFVKPVYPEDARKEGREGTVILETVVSRTGDVEGARVLTSDPVFDEAALQSVRQWKYSPALKDGKPVKVYLTVTVAFKLK